MPARRRAAPRSRSRRVVVAPYASTSRAQMHGSEAPGTLEEEEDGSPERGGAPASCVGRRPKGGTVFEIPTGWTVFHIPSASWAPTVRPIRRVRPRWERCRGCLPCQVQAECAAADETRRPSARRTLVAARTCRSSSSGSELGTRRGVAGGELLQQRPLHRRRHSPPGRTAAGDQHKPRESTLLGNNLAAAVVASASSSSG
jgi:hypothetical protein